ncbi:MAG: hypothetical protein GY856_46515 [bacterium]|nr:hypothetical protein [bacterium]
MHRAFLAVLVFQAAFVGAQTPELSLTGVTVAELAPATVPVVLTTNGAL